MVTFNYKTTYVCIVLVMIDSSRARIPCYRHRVPHLRHAFSRYQNVYTTNMKKINIHQLATHNYAIIPSLKLLSNLLYF